MLLLAAAGGFYLRIPNGRDTNIICRKMLSKVHLVSVLHPLMASSTVTFGSAPLLTNILVQTCHNKDESNELIMNHILK